MENHKGVFNELYHSMRLTIITISILTFTFTALAQNKGDVSFEFSMNRTNYGTESLNSYLMDTIQYFPTYAYGTSQQNNIKNGLDFGLSLAYQPLNCFDFGVYGSFQSGSISRNMAWEFQPDPINNPDIDSIRYGTNEIKISSLSVGLFSTLYLNKLFNSNESSNHFVKNLQYFIALKGGIGVSTFSDRAGYSDFNFEIKRFQYQSTDFSGRIELGIGYEFVRKSVFSAVGIKGGYQFLKTKGLKNYQGNPLIVPNHENEPVQLNFSGFYYGLYLKIGK